MPLSFTTTQNPGDSYVDVRVGEGHAIHQIKLNAANLAASRDADDYLPAGLPVKADGTAVAATQAPYAFIGPEAVKLGANDIFANVILTGVLNRDAIEANLGRVLTADEANVPAAIRLL